MRSFTILAVLTLAAAPLAAQTVVESGPPARELSFNSGIKLRGAFHVNRANVSGVAEIPESENGYGAGVEINGRHLGVGLYGYTAGKAKDFDSESTPVLVVAEANYFLPIEMIRLAPYAGIHTGLGTFTKEYFEKPFAPRPQDGFSGLGYQVGVRFKPVPLVSIDAQWRRQSGFAFENQDPTLERTQVLVGVVLF